MKTRFEINEINNGWVISFYNESGQQTYFFNKPEDMVEILNRLIFKEENPYSQYNKDSRGLRNG